MVYNTSANHTETLVLYSSKSNVWKIADFGITTEGTSGRALTTVASRGTASYRAPELLDASKSTYTRQVDIWALGCIFYDLTFTKQRHSPNKANVNPKPLLKFAYVRFRHLLKSPFNDESPVHTQRCSSSL